MNEAFKASAELVLDQLLNDPIHQNTMSEWISSRWTYPDITLEQATSEEMENSPVQALYYTLTAEYHSKVLSLAIYYLSN